VLFSRIYRMVTPTEIGIFSAKADYEQDFLKGKLGAGVKFSVVATDNIFDFYDINESRDVLNADRSNIFQYSEQINAAYLNYNRKWKKTNVQAGLRAEQTISDGQLISTQNNSDARVKRNYVNLFPSGGITYSMDGNNSLALSYSRRIERPSYQSLNPFEWQLDELSFQKGNAFLQPQYTDNIKISHTYKYTLTTALSYAYISDFFAQITDTLGGNRNFLMERNIANQRILNLSVTYPVQIKKWWNTFWSLNAYHTDFSSHDPKFQDIQANVLNIYGQNTFTLPRKWNLEVSGWFNSPGIWGGTYATRSQGSLDVAVQKKVLRDKMSVRLSVSDLLFTSPWSGVTQFGGVRINGNGGWESRQVRLNLSYNFGNRQVKNARQRAIGMEEESKRIN
jgi:iron complex outermembrane recepter protein